MLLTCLAALQPLFADEAFDRAIEHLERMSAAMTQMDYQGTFVYVQGQQVETMRITHVVDEQGIHERLVTRGGSQREIIRDASGVRWIANDTQAVMQDPSLSRSYFPEISPNAILEASAQYHIALGGQEAQAGRMGRKLSIRPRDEYRYGYTLWLEEPSGLLLRWEIYQDSARPIARLMFTDLRLGDDVDRTELRPSQAVNDYQMRATELPEKQEVTLAQPRWAPASIPPGFELTAHRRQDKNSPDLYQHLVYSDGIAAVSVYVEQLSGIADPLSGLRKIGTTHAFSRHADGLQVTVVGDVPAKTVEEMGQAVALINR